MSDDLSLFGDGPHPEPQVVATPTPIADWQRDLIREALDARGVTSTEDRRRAVEEAAGRDVTALRDLTSDEAIRVLNKLGEAGSSGERSASLWDSRDEDTWIDRL